MSGRRGFAALLLSLPLAGPALAAPPCEPGRGLNLVAVQFEVRKGEEQWKKPPTTFRLKRPGDVAISVNNPGGSTWTGEILDHAVVGGTSGWMPDFGFSGYEIEARPDRGGNQIIAGRCYATFVFHLKKVAWQVAAKPSPSTCCSFAYRRNGKGDYHPSGLERMGATIGNLKLDDETVDLKLYTTVNNKPLYLFHLSLAGPGDLKLYDRTEIVQRIFSARTLGRKRGDEIHDEDDPYLPLAKSNQMGRNAISDAFASQTVDIDDLALQALKLSDPLEDNP